MGRGGLLFADDFVGVNESEEKAYRCSAFLLLEVETEG